MARRPLTPDCIADAIRIIKIGLAVGSARLPTLRLEGTGAFGIEWWDPDRWVLSIHLVPGVQNTYALDLLNPDGTVEASDGAIENDDQIRRIISLMV